MTKRWTTGAFTRRGVLASGMLAVLVCLLSVSRAGAAEQIGAAERGGEPLRIVVTVPALKGLVEPLAPKGTSIRMLMQPGRSEHGYEFTASDIAALAEADVVVYVGLNLESRFDELLARPAKSSRRVVQFAAAVGIAADAHDHSDHADHEHEEKDHDGTCDHEHGPVDPHLWLDPVLVEKFVPAVQNGIKEAMESRGELTEPAKATLDQAAADLVRSVRQVDERWRERLAPFAGKAVVTHHNAFPRVAERYGFRVATAIRTFEHAEPTPAQLAEIVNAIREQKVGVIFTEPQFNPAAAERIAKAAKVRVGRLDPLGDGDWFGMMQKNLDAMVDGLGGGLSGGSGGGKK